MVKILKDFFRVKCAGMLKTGSLVFTINLVALLVVAFTQFFMAKTLPLKEFGVYSESMAIA